MTARRKPPVSQAERDLQRVIGILAEALAERETGRVRVRADLPSVANRVRPVADALIRCMAEGDTDGAWEILGRRRTASEWRRLALLLASAADPGRLAAPAERRAA